MTELRNKGNEIVRQAGRSLCRYGIIGRWQVHLCAAEGRITKIEAESGKAEPVSINGEMVLKQAAEKDYIFDHAWRQLEREILCRRPGRSGLGFLLYCIQKISTLYQ